MGNPIKKKKQDSSSDSESNSDSDSSKRKQRDKELKKRRSPSSDSEKRPKSSKNPKETEKNKKYKYDDVQKSKWDSPAENISKNNDRYKDSRNKRYDSRKHYDRPKHDRREDHREDYREKNLRDKRGGQRHERPDRRPNDRYRSEKRRSRERDRNNFRNRRTKTDAEDNENYEWGKKKAEEKKAPVEKEKPNFGVSGKLVEDTNTYRGIVIKYSEPPEARKPKRRWRLYPFKGEKALPTLYIHRESAYLMGRERKVVDFPLDHPSCSKQHAVLQYRLVPFTREDGSAGKRVRPYLIDLDSANGTFINNKRIDPRKYVELLEKDVIKFGYSTREYVLLHENSKDEALDDDVKPEEEVGVKEEQE